MPREGAKTSPPWFPRGPGGRAEGRAPDTGASPSRPRRGMGEASGRRGHGDFSSASAPGEIRNGKTEGRLRCPSVREYRGSPERRGRAAPPAARGGWAETRRRGAGPAPGARATPGGRLASRLAGRSIRRSTQSLRPDGPVRRDHARRAISGARTTVARLPAGRRNRGSGDRSGRAARLLDRGGSPPLNGAQPTRGPISARNGRGCSSDGRALQSHCRGQGFDSPQLHQFTTHIRRFSAVFCCLNFGHPSSHPSSRHGPGQLGTDEGGRSQRRNSLPMPSRVVREETGAKSVKGPAAGVRTTSRVRWALKPV